MAGELQYRSTDGSLLHKSDGSLQAECCCPEPCDCDLPGHYSYKIADYADGDILACPACAQGGPNDWVWDGAFHAWAPCEWRIEFPMPYPMKMNGRKLAEVRLVLADKKQCRWEMSIQCGLYPQNVTVAWAGNKFGGRTPEGNYHRTDGCNNIDTLTIVLNY